jgi:hypothetical protein
VLGWYLFRNVCTIFTMKLCSDLTLLQKWHQGRERMNMDGGFRPAISSPTTPTLHPSSVDTNNTQVTTIFFKVGKGIERGGEADGWGECAHSFPDLTSVKQHQSHYNFLWFIHIRGMYSKRTYSWLDGDMLTWLPHGVRYDSRGFRRFISLKNLLEPVAQISAVPYYIVSALPI